MGAVALVAAASACGGSSADTTSAPASAAVADATESADNADGGQASANPLFVGTKATVAGSTFDLGSLEGKDTVLWFWAPW